ncbi:MAG: hypothetical protein ABF497_08085, partial [Sporolactobacillus sp.]
MVTEAMRVPLKEGARLELKVEGRVDTYTIGCVIGYGGSCIVYRATKLEAGLFEDSRPIRRPAVIKEFYPSSVDGIIRRADGSLLIGDEGDLENFDRLKALFLGGYLNHVAFNEIDTNHKLPSPIRGEANGTDYIILEPANGDSLDKTRDDISGIFEITQIMLSLCNALLTLHDDANGVRLYLDLKPQNIFLFKKDVSETHRVALFDFDTVIPLSDILEDNVPYRVSTEGWAPPEQEQWQTRSFSKATDIYALGAVLFWLITGKIPGDADLEAIRSNRLTLPDDSIYSTT